MWIFYSALVLFLIHGTKCQNYTVTAVLDPPYVIDNGDGTFSGFMIDFLDDLSKRDKFSYEMTLAADGLYGSEHNGKWTGMIGELLDDTEEVHIAAGPIIVTEQRRTAVPFTRPFQHTSYRILMKKPVVEFHSLKVLFQPFSLPLWIMVIVICFVVSAMLFIVNKFSPSEWSQVKPEDDPTNARDSFTPHNAFFFVHSTLTWQGYKEVPRSPAGRILVTMWFSFIFFMVIAYIANLTAFLIARDIDKPVIPFKTWEEMTAQSSVSYGYSMSKMFFKKIQDSEDPMLQALARNVDTYYTYFNEYEEAVEKIRESDGTFAAIVPIDVGQKYVTKEPCDLIMVGARMFEIPDALACRTADICNRLSFALLKMIEDGTLYSLQQKWLKPKNNCPATSIDDYVSKHETAQISARPLSIADASLAFVVLLMGVVLSIIFLVIEVLVHRRKSKSANLADKGNTNNIATDDDVEKAKLTDEPEKAPMATNEA